MNLFHDDGAIFMRWSFFDCLAATRSSAGCTAARDRIEGRYGHDIHAGRKNRVETDKTGRQRREGEKLNRMNCKRTVPHIIAVNSVGATIKWPISAGLTFN